MTIGAGGESNQQVLVDEKTPLLPTTWVGEEAEEQSEEFVGGSEFNGASFGGAVFNLSTTIVGAGIMALPATMKVLGLLPGILLIAFTGFLTEGSIGMLLRSSRAGKSTSYGAVMKDAFGKPGRILIQICVVINNLGVLVVYMIIIGDVISGTSASGVHHSGILEGWFGPHWWNGRFFVLVVTTLTIFAPLSCFKRVDSLRYTSALSVALAVVFVVITAGIAVIKLANGSISMPRLFPHEIADLSAVWSLFTVVPILVTAYICHYNVHPIENELEDPAQIKPIVRSSLALCSTVYITTSFFGFLLFGDDTLDDVLANFDAQLGIPYSSLLNDSVRVSYAVHLMLVFPIIFFSLRLNLDGLLFPHSRPLNRDNWRFAIVTIGLIALIFLGANFIPSIWDAFQFTGATAAICIGFIFPAAIMLKDPHHIATKPDRILSVFMIILSIFSSGVAIYSDAVSMINRDETSLLNHPCRGC